MRERTPSAQADLESAAAGDAAALERVTHTWRETVHALLTDGRARWGDLGLDARACAGALARVLTAQLGAERAHGGDVTPPVEDLARCLVLPDLYLAEALVRGVPAAWRHFEQVVDAAWRSVRGHFAARATHGLLEDVRESVLGTFFLDRKVTTYRATAPLGAWARQVAFNLFRQALNQRSTGKEPIPLSQLGAEDRDEDRWIPTAEGAEPPEILVAKEWDAALRRIIPALVASLDRDERRMLEVLPSRQLTQVELCKEMGISPFKLNRWYKELRARFLRQVAQELRLLLGVEVSEVDALMAYVARLCGSPPPNSSGTEFSQEEGPDRSTPWSESAGEPPGTGPTRPDRR